MSSIPSSNIRCISTIICLTLEVNDGIISTQIKSLIPPFSARKGVSCGGVLQVKGQDAYAMVRGRYTGKWGFPKGKKESCETELEGALREVEEEVGVWNLGEPVGRFKGTGNQVYFLFHVDDYLPLRPLDIMEVAETRWVTLEDMTKLDTNQGVKSFLKWILKR